MQSQGQQENLKELKPHKVSALHNNKIKLEELYAITRNVLFQFHKIKTEKKLTQETKTLAKKGVLSRYLNH